MECSLGVGQGPYTFIESCSKHIYRLFNYVEGRGSHYYEMHYHEKKKDTSPKPGKRLAEWHFSHPIFLLKQKRKTYNERIELSLMSTVNFRDFICIEDIIITVVAMFPKFKWVSSMHLSKCHLLILLSTQQIGIYNLVDL